MGEGPGRQLLRLVEIIIDQVAGIFFGGGRAGAEVKNGGKLTKRTGICPDAGPKIGGFDVVGEFQRHEVLPLFIGPQDVGHDDFGVSALIKSGNQSAADKTGATGDQDHGTGV